VVSFNSFMNQSFQHVVHLRCLKSGAGSIKLLIE
jgi:hypothetical protein